MPTPKRNWRPTYRATGAGMGAIAGTRAHHGHTPSPPAERRPHRRREPKPIPREVIEAALAEFSQPPQIHDEPRRCPGCGVAPSGRPRNDGRLRRHRVEVDNPLAAWCDYDDTPTPL